MQGGVPLQFELNYSDVFTPFELVIKESLIPECCKGKTDLPDISNLATLVGDKVI
jgi:hypothetical protein